MDVERLQVKIYKKNYFRNFLKLKLDSICDLPMEINFAFYPPPTINLPNLEIPDLKEYKVFNYEYFGNNF